MTLLGKIREYGLARSLARVPRAVGRSMRHRWFDRCFRRSQKLPVDEGLVVLESEGDLSDNAYALYDYMRGAGYLASYRVVWAVEDVERAERMTAESPGEWPNTKFACKAADAFDPGLARALATCGWFIYDHCNLMARLEKRAGQQVVFLSHGCGYKGPKGADPNDDVTPYDFMTVTGPLAAVCVSNWQRRPAELAVCTGYPRNDYLLAGDPASDSAVREWLGLGAGQKLVLWMPTFRQSRNAGISEDYLSSETGLPLFSAREDLARFSDFLAAEGIVLVLKLHHLQAELPIFGERFPNVLLVRDEDLRARGLQLYQFVRCADALISDYSSISVDYMLLDRPIVYTLDDYEEYAASRGLFPENAVDYMPGYHVYDVAQLEAALAQIAAGEDVHRADRLSIIGRYHAHRDAGSAERVLRACGIRK